MKHHDLQYEINTGLRCISCGTYAVYTKSGLVLYRTESIDSVTEDCDFESIIKPVIES